MKVTDWDSYYGRPYKTATITRRYTASVVATLMSDASGRGAKILEIGGANSCFIDHILLQVKPARYVVIDNNALGIRLLRERFPHDDRVSASIGDVLSTESAAPIYDIVYSVGLIEHFDRSRTARAIEGHFAFLRPGGLAIITFPTPTLLYLTVRRIAEMSGQWMFHDERPLTLSEVRETVCRHGELTFARILWPLILTQYCIAVRKRF